LFYMASILLLMFCTNAPYSFQSIPCQNVIYS
jgi:hypothetical protein